MASAEATPDLEARAPPTSEAEAPPSYSAEQPSSASQAAADTAPPPFVPSPVPSQSGGEKATEARDEWADLQPIAQMDTEKPLCAIAYTAEYRQSMDLFRALVKKGELSERGLVLTQTIIKLNPAHYSVWAYRFKILLHLREERPEGKWLEKELDLMDSLVKAHLKSYQIWQHRRNVVIVLDDPSRELPFVEKGLAIDSKNYHTWAYRQWVLCHFDRKELWATELDFTKHLLHVDVRNNSAWNHRFFLVFESGRSSFVYPSSTSASEEKGSEVDEKVVQKEIDFVKGKILVAPNNPSAWNYLRGVLKRAGKPLSTISNFAAPLTQSSFSSSGSAPDSLSASDFPTSSAEGGDVQVLNPRAELPVVAAVEFLADALAEEEVKFGRSGKALEAASLYGQLEEKLDPIRKRYWGWKRKGMEKYAHQAREAEAAA